MSEYPDNQRLNIVGFVTPVVFLAHMTIGKYGNQRRNILILKLAGDKTKDFWAALTFPRVEKVTK